MSENNNPDSRQSARQEMSALPSSMLEKEFGKVYIGEDGLERHVEFTVWVKELSGARAEGWRTGLALDASASMRDWYGACVVYTEAGLPQDVLDEYARKGWAEKRVIDGERNWSLTQEAYDDALKQGYVKYTENIVEPLARDFTAYLADELDTKGRTAVLYWACGNGDATEVVGEFSAEGCKDLKISGPSNVKFGAGTQLLPALQYFCRTYEDADSAMFVFITDGRLDDLEEVKLFTAELAKQIDKDQRNPVKCVLIGVGSEIDEAQMEELDDLETGTDVDVWDHKIAKEMRALSEIMVELVDDVVSTLPATVYDDKGKVVKKYTDGLPASVSFSMPVSSNYFELEVGTHRVKQNIVMTPA